MSRVEAARVYLDVMLGWRSDYAAFCLAAETLSEREKDALIDAVGQRWIGGT